MRKILLGLAFLLAWANAYAGLNITPGPVYADQGGNVAIAGYVGSQVAPTNLTGVPLTTGTATQISSVILPAGVWDVECVFTATLTSAIITAMITGISTSPTAFLGANTGSLTSITGVSTGTGGSVVTPDYRTAVTTTTTYYCLGYATISSGTVTGAGFMRVTRVN